VFLCVLYGEIFFLLALRSLPLWSIIKFGCRLATGTPQV
jgi:hypothetical protein